MAYTVKWTLKAKNDYISILSYLQSTWTTKEIQRFVDKTNCILVLISEKPKLFPASKKKDIRKCVLFKQTSLY